VPHDEARGAGQGAQGHLVAGFAHGFAAGGRGGAVDGDFARGIETVAVDDGEIFEGDVGAVAQVEGSHAPVAGRGAGAAQPHVAGLRVGQHHAFLALAFQHEVSLAVEVDFLAVGAVFEVHRARFRRRVGQAVDGRLNGAELPRAIRRHRHHLGLDRVQAQQQEP
jgi:hypothetical protein